VALPHATVQMFGWVSRSANKERSGAMMLIWQ
jgi:hypothetical protein